MNILDNFLNKITMYRLVLYYLILLLVGAYIYSILKILPYSITSLSLSIFILLITCLISNWIFAKIYNAHPNVESVYISALILALIITPIRSAQEIPFLVWAGVITMASKYILAINRKHLFNPVAIGVVLTSLGFNGIASWWVGTLPMLPLVLLGILIIKKIRKGDLVFYFILFAFASIFFFTILNKGNISNILYDTVFSSPLFFFAFIMLTEPSTTPPTKFLQSIYGTFVGILFAPQFHIFSFYTTPETALIIGNTLSYLVSPKITIIEKIKSKVKIGTNIMDFLLLKPSNLKFQAGQYMEWTLPHKSPDRRGNRRFFTIASSPTEKDLRIGVKFYPKGSSYKREMENLKSDSILIGSQIAGDFTLPKDKNKKLVFIAGGIGITPFRSMLKYLIDKREKRDIILFYTNKRKDEIVYKDVLDDAQNKLGIKTIYVLTDKEFIPYDWSGKKERINGKMISQEVPDFMERTFYMSGSNSIIDTMQKILISIGVSKRKIKKDYFAGL